MACITSNCYNPTPEYLIIEHFDSWVYLSAAWASLAWVLSSADLGKGRLLFNEGFNEGFGILGYMTGSPLWKKHPV